MQAQITLKTRDLETGEDVRVELLPPVQQVTFAAKTVTIDESGNTVLSLTN